MSLDIQSLVGPGISVKPADLAAYTAQNTVRVKAHVGRNRGIVPMPVKQFGLKEQKLGQAGQAFYSGHLQAGRLSLIPIADEQCFGRLEARLRNAIARAEVIEGLIPVTAYPSIKQEFQDIRDEYMAARDDVLSRWDSLVDEFKAGAAEMLSGVRMQKRVRTQHYQTIIASIPSKNAYENSFFMELEVTAFPAVAVPEGLNASIAADIEKSVKDNVLTTALKVIEKGIGEGFALLGKAAGAYSDRGMIAPKTLDRLERYGTDIQWKNFFHNPALDAISRKMTAISREESMDGKEMLVEEAIIDLWQYGKDNGLRLDAGCTPFTTDVLDTMLQIRLDAQSNRRQASIFDSQTA